jgi:hypothetical protein
MTRETEAPGTRRPARGEQELRAEVDRAREQLAETVAELAGKADVRTRAREKATQVRGRARDKATETRERARHTARQAGAPGGGPNGGRGSGRGPGRGATLTAGAAAVVAAAIAYGVLRTRRGRGRRWP